MRCVQLFAFAASSLSVAAKPHDVDESGVGVSFSKGVAHAWSNGEGAPQDSDAAPAVEDNDSLEKLQHAVEHELMSNDDEVENPYTAELAALVNDAKPEVLSLKQDEELESIPHQIDHLKQEVDSLQQYLSAVPKEQKSGRSHRGTSTSSHHRASTATLENAEERDLQKARLNVKKAMVSLDTEKHGHHLSHGHSREEAGLLTARLKAMMSLDPEEDAGAAPDPLPLGTVVEAFGLGKELDGLQGMVVSGEGDLATVDFGDAGGVHSVDPEHLKVVQQSPLTADGKLRTSLTSQRTAAGAAADLLPLGTMVEAVDLGKSEINGLVGMVVSGEDELTTVDFGDEGGTHSVDPAHLKVVQESPLTADGRLRSSLTSQDFAAGAAAAPLPLGSLVEAVGFESIFGENFNGLVGRVVSGEGELTSVDFGDSAGVHSVDPAYLKVLQHSPLTAEGKLKSRLHRSHIATSSSPHHDLEDVKAVHFVLEGSNSSKKIHSNEAVHFVLEGSNSSKKIHSNEAVHFVLEGSNSSKKIHSNEDVHFVLEGSNSSKKIHSNEAHTDMHKDVLRAVVHEVVDKFGLDKDAMRKALAHNGISEKNHSHKAHAKSSVRNGGDAPPSHGMDFDTKVLDDTEDALMAAADQFREVSDAIVQVEPSSNSKGSKIHSKSHDGSSKGDAGGARSPSTHATHTEEIHEDVLMSVVDLLRESRRKYGDAAEKKAAEKYDAFNEQETAQERASADAALAHAPSSPVPTPEQLLGPPEQLLGRHSQERHLTARKFADVQASDASEAAQEKRLTSAHAEWQAAGAVEAFPAGVSVGETLQRRLAVAKELEDDGSQVPTNITELKVQPFDAGHTHPATLLQLAAVAEAEAGSTFLFGGDDDP